MGWHARHKIQTRERILASAAELFTTSGFEKVGINEIMTNAGLTRGAFYAHFKSKAELYSEAILFAAKTRAADIPVDASHSTIAEHYLSDEHVSGQFGGCPLAFLVNDISQRDEPIRSTYSQVFAALVRRLEQTGLSRVQAIQQAVIMIGGVAIARTLNDEALRSELLGCCRPGSSNA
jgi:TetR/AcrR family transcriptional regulator, transcriptional repressor for nem operon